MTMDYRVEVWWCGLCRSARRAMYRVVDGVDFPTHHYLDDNSRPVMREVGWRTPSARDDKGPFCIRCRSDVEPWPEATAAHALHPDDDTIEAMVRGRLGG